MKNLSFAQNLHGGGRCGRAFWAFCAIFTFTVLSASALIAARWAQVNATLHRQRRPRSRGATAAVKLPNVAVRQNAITEVTPRY